MFGQSWRQIRIQVPALLADIAYQVEHRVEPVDQIAIRFHHRLVCIYPFPNDNGRHARLIADVLIEQLGAPRFSWGGSSSLVKASSLRQPYIAALQQSDRDDLTALLAFARESCALLGGARGICGAEPRAAAGALSPHRRNQATWFPTGSRLRVFRVTCLYLESK